jgi:hypothetical protein
VIGDKLIGGDDIGENATIERLCVVGVGGGWRGEARRLKTDAQV